MSFKEFDLSDYISALENFKKNSTEAIMKHWGSVENFDLFLTKIKEDESEVAQTCHQTIRQRGKVHRSHEIQS